MTTTPKSSKARRRTHASGDPDVLRVEKLVDRMRHGFLDAQDAALELLNSAGWAVLKYGSCYTFWAARMADVDVSVPVMKQAAYIMFDEDISPRKAAGAIKGLTPLTAAALKRQKDNGLEPDEASLNTNSVKPRPSVDRKTRLVIFEVDYDEYNEEWSPKIPHLPTMAESTSATDALNTFALESTRAALKRVRIKSGV
jgi:hypothetical protein